MRTHADEAGGDRLYLDYLKATGLHLCLLLDFGKSRIESHRIAHGL